MEREGAEVLVQGPTLEARASSYGPEDPALPGLPLGRPGGKQPRRGGHTVTPTADDETIRFKADHFQSTINLARLGDPVQNPPSC